MKTTSGAPRDMPLGGLAPKCNAGHSAAAVANDRADEQATLVNGATPAIDAATHAAPQPGHQNESVSNLIRCARSDAAAGAAAGVAVVGAGVVIGVGVGYAVAGAAGMGQGAIAGLSSIPLGGGVCGLVMSLLRMRRDGSAPQEQPRDFPGLDP